MKAPVNILNNDFCANPDPWEEGNFKNLYYRKMYSHNMVCAGHEKGFMDACQDQIKNFNNFFFILLIWLFFFNFSVYWLNIFFYM